VPREKVVRIPIGVDTELFVPPREEERRAARAAFGIADEQVAVGSFQKDGVGWGDGMEPKLIKGPDIFLEVVERLRSEIPLFVVLTGPAPYAHVYVDGHDKLVPCYHALDLYFVTSREEGGPMALIEGMASGVPVVSTAVGMAPDLVRNGITGGLVEPEDIEEFCTASLAILNSTDRSAALRAAAREAVKMCDWRIVGRDHLEKVYRPLL
jgi:glycosyltransferase involved in cell wall biosynthesis